jgi:hypothetical protein
MAALYISRVGDQTQHYEDQNVYYQTRINTTHMKALFDFIDTSYAAGLFMIVFFVIIMVIAIVIAKRGIKNARKL